MKLKSKHTPLPWRADWLDDENGWILAPNYYENDLSLYIAEIVTKDSEGLYETNIDKQKANADLIIRAVNSHDELLAACKNALLWLSDSDDEGDVERQEELTAAIKKAEAK